MASAVISPSLPPGQLTGKMLMIEAVGPTESLTVIVAIPVQPFASVILTMYPPANRESAVKVVCAEGSSQRKV